MSCHCCFVKFNDFFLYLVYLAAVLEYLAAKILKLEGNTTHDNKKHCIVPCHLQLHVSICNDEEYVLLHLVACVLLISMS